MLAELRTEIEAVSVELVRLLDRRFELAQAIRVEKGRLGLPLYDPAREDELIDRLARKSLGHVPEDALRRILRRVLDESLTAMQRADSQDLKE